MENQGKTPKQQRDSLFIFEVAFWIIAAIIMFVLLLPSNANASEPFAPKAKHYKSNSFKKSKPFKKDAFVCTRAKKVNRKGLMR